MGVISMGFKTKNLCFQSLSKDYKIGLKDYSGLFEGGIPLKELLLSKNYESDIKSGTTPSRFNMDYWNGEYDFITLSDVDIITYGLNSSIVDKITDEAINDNNLVLVPKNSLIISNAMTIGLAFITDRPVYINQNVFWIKVDDKRVNTTFLLWYINLFLRPHFQDLYYSKYLSKLELSMVHVPNIPIEVQNIAAKRINDILEKIKKIQQSRITLIEIIDEVFSQHFSLDHDLRNKLHKGMTFGTQSSTNTRFSTFTSSLDQLSKTGTIRLSARSVTPIFSELEEIVKKQGYFSINEIVAEEIHRGKAPTYVSDGEIPVVKTAHLKNGEVLISEEEFVTKSFFESKPLAQVFKGDILIASTGKPSIGKVDLMEHDIEMFADSHVTILRINEDRCLKKFLVYYLWSVLGCYQIEKEYAGSTNQIEIYPDQIGNIIIPDISISVQEQIIQEIQDKISKQSEISTKISQLRNDINKIISDVINAE